MTTPASDSATHGTFRASFPVGRIAGIEVRVHVTFVLLVGLLVLSAGDRTGGVARMLVWLGVVFGSVLVHELAHSLVGRRRGGSVRAIVLLPIGGVSQLERVPETPQAEFAVAVVGPLTSLGLAAVAGGLALAMGGSIGDWSVDAGPFLGQVAAINLMLGLFNLLPAFPLDGGRVLRSLLERRMDDERATRLAATLGRGLGAAMIGFGLFSNLWLVFIGVFVLFGAAAEEATAVVHIRLRGVRVGQVMTPVVDDGNDAEEALEPPVLSVYDRVDPTALDAFSSSHRSVLAVVDGGRLVGTVTMADVGRALSTHGKT